MAPMAAAPVASEQFGDGTDPSAIDDEALDILFRGRVALLQRKRGYRSSVDALMLAAFALERVPAPRHVLDLGTGTGLVALLIALRCPRARLLLIERQEPLVDRARRNLALNDVADRAEVLAHDLADPWPGERGGACFDLIVTNPPYFRRAGRMVPTDRERADAHYESSAGVERFVEQAAALLRADGRLCAVYPSSGSERLRGALDAVGLTDQRWREVRHRAGAAANRVLVDAGTGAAARVALEAWTLHRREPPRGRYHPTIEALIEALRPRHAAD